MTKRNLFTVVASFAILTVVTAIAWADPLPNEILKFQQLPLNNGQGPSAGGAPYPGHNERSTAYLYTNTAGTPAGYQGSYMADDFGDKLSSPIVHIKWWGSYANNFTGNSNAGVQQFLITFESDIPAQPGTTSRPGVPLLSQIVTPGAISPGSGTFTESMINGNVPEHLYQYNAELNLGQSFPELADTVYWLKIVALVDANAEGPIGWGWHSRDYSFQNTFASTTGLSVPGEQIIGFVGPAASPTPVWHYQDDAVTGGIDVQLLAPNGLNVIQNAWVPQNYIDNVDGPVGIGNFSKDLAFELYTVVPEPSSIVMLSFGVVGLVGASVVCRRKRRGA